MITTRVLCVCGRFLSTVLVCLVLPLAVLAGCASAPSSPGEESASDIVQQISGETLPEIVEIRGPVPLPVRMAVLLPDPEVRSSISTDGEKEPDLTPAEAKLPEASVPLPAPAAPLKLSAPSPAAKTASKTPAVSAETKKPAASSATTKSAASPKDAPAKPASVPDAEPSEADSSRSPAIPLPSAPASTVLTAPLQTPEASRSQEADRGAAVELPFKGSGWVYLGETGGREGMRYDSRKFDGTAAVFLFTAERAGEYLLRFQRQDPVSGEPESLLVKVLVKEPEPESAEAAAEKGGSTASSKSGKDASTVSAAASAAPAPLPAASAAAAASPLPTRELPSSPEELIRLARTELAAARIASTLEVLDKYISLYPFGSDEAFYIYAKAYEHNTPYRDIKKAYGYYKQIRDEWPRSPFWKNAAERVAYIERHYFDIR